MEVAFGRDFIRRCGWRKLVEVQEVDVLSEFEESVKDLVFEVPSEELDRLNKGELGSLLLFLRGYDVKASCSKNTYYAHRKRIKEVTGYDIGAENITRLPVKSKVIVLRPVSEADKPDWYDQDEVLEG